MAAEVEAVRQFNRFYTTKFELLRNDFLGSPFGLTEARVLYELARGTQPTAAALREHLRLDAGYLSRILARFETGGLLRRKPHPMDGRASLLEITGKGKALFRSMEERQKATVAAMIAALGPRERERLLVAMRGIEGLLDPAGRNVASVEIRSPAPGDMGWVIERHGAIYAEEFGWNEEFEALVAEIVARFATSHDPTRERAWIATMGGERVGCVFCVRKNATTAQLRILLVEPHARGHGIGARLVQECLAFAKAAGYRSIVLWTNDVLVSARKIYEACGFRLVEQEKHHSFGKDLVGQNWALSLDDVSPAPPKRMGRARPRTVKSHSPGSRARHRTG
ncbi:MAG: bifunctional helix-turn-helix transcriptional regulator/GNAT family N-acetyltransferase [Thermoplasmatota archaeon]